MSQGKGQSSTPRPRYFESATQLLASLRERRIGAVELLNLHLEQVDKHNPALNLVVARDFEGALAAARRADDTAQSDRGPLHGLTTTGVCDIMVFAGIPGGPMDCWDDVSESEHHLACSLALLERIAPAEFERCANVVLTDTGGVLRGRITPQVRVPVAKLPSGRPVIGMGDAVVLLDPLTG